MSRPFNHLHLLLALLLSATGGHAASLTVSPAADTTLFEHDPNSNLGVSTLVAGSLDSIRGSGLRSRALIRFDVSAVPSGATITSAQLAVQVSKIPPSAAASVYGVHRLLNSWNEGNGSGARGLPASPGETTWNARLFPGTPWGAPGAAAGTDFSAGASSSVLIDGFGTFIFPSGSTLLADVQSWVNNPSANFGWIMISQSEGTPLTAKRFGSRDTGGAPQLMIEYTAPAPPSQTLTVALAGAGAGRVTSDPAGIDCGTSCSVSFPSGSVVTLTAAPQPGSVFIGWTGAGTGNGATRTVTMDAARNVTARFEPANRPPVANSQSVSLPEDSSALIVLTGADPDGNPLQFTVVSFPTRGLLSGTEPNVTYTPDPNYFGADSFSFVASDGTAQSTPATVSLAITAINDSPAISAISDQDVTVNGTLASINFTVSDLETPAADLIPTADSSNLSLLPASGMILGGSGSNRTLELRPAQNQSGSATVTLVVADAQGGSATNSFVLRVGCPAGGPTLSELPAQTVDEDNPMPPVVFTVSDPVVAASNIRIQAASANPALVRSDQIIVTGNAATRTVSVIPEPNQSGSAVITLFAIRDAPCPATNSRAFTLVVNPINDPPVISDIPNQSLSSCETNQTTIPFSFYDLDEDPATLRLFAESSNPGLVTASNIVFTFNNTNGTVTITSNPQQTGSTVITITVIDSAGLTATDQFTVVITPPQTPPTISDIPDLVIDEDTVAGPIQFGIGAACKAPDLILPAQSSNTNLINPAAIVFGGTNGNRTLSLTPNTNQFGSATITVTVRDQDGNTASDTFLLRVNPVNDPPHISAVPGQTISQCQTLTVSVSISDPETSAPNLLVKFQSTNPTLLPEENITISSISNAAERVLMFKPIEQREGATLISVMAFDAEGLSATNTFQLTVIGPPDGPNISQVPDQVTDEDTPTAIIPFTVGHPTVPASNVTVIVTSSNPDLVSLTNIVLGGTGANRSLIITPSTNKFGAARVTLQIEGLDPCQTQSSASFNFTVRPVNDPPIARPDEVGTFEGRSVSIPVLANDSDAENDALELRSLIQSANGVATITTNQAVVFAPNTGFNGTNSFQYLVGDPAGLTSTGTVTVVVHPLPRIQTQRVTGEAPRFSFSTIPGADYVIEASTNLFDWTPVTTNLAETANVDFTDPGATNFIRRFYRLRVP